MSILKNNLILLVLVTFSVAASVMARDVVHLLIFLLALLMVYFLPGLAISKLFKLVQMQKYDYNKVVFSSFALGYCWSILMYIILLIIGIPHIVLYATIIIALLSFVYLRKDFVSISNFKAKNVVFISGVLAFCYLISLVNFQYCNLSAEEIGVQNLHPDLMFWLKNTVAATKVYPLPDLSDLGNTFYYHYFSSLGLANLRYVTGIELYDLCFSYSYIINIFLLVGSVYVLCSEFMSRQSYLYYSILLILFTTTYEPITLTYYTSHLYFGSFGLTEGFALTLFSYYLYNSYGREGKTINGLVVSLLVFCIAVGAKAPLALVLLFGIGFDILIKLFKREELMKNLIIGFSYCMVFLITICLFVLNLSPHFSSRPGGGLSLSGRTAFVSGFFKEMSYSLNELYPLLPLYLLLSLILYILINSFITISLASIVFGRYKAIKFRDTHLEMLFMLIVGYLLFLLFSQDGFSQVYFYFISIPFGIIYFLSIIDKEDIKITKIERSFLTVMTIIGFACFINSCTNKFSSALSKSYTVAEQTGNIISDEEIKVLRWIRDNVDNNAVLISNKIQLKDGRRSFVVSSFSERQCYMEGYYYNVWKEDPVISKRHKLIVDLFEKKGDCSCALKEEGVTHVILFKSVNKKEPKVDGKVIYNDKAAKVIEL